MASLMRTEPCVSDLVLDRRLSGELDAAEERELDAHLASCVRCSVRFDVISRQYRGFLQRAPKWHAFVEQHLPRAQVAPPAPTAPLAGPASLPSARPISPDPPGSRPPPSARRRRWLPWSAPGLALSTAFAALLLLRAPDSVTRTKGAPSIGFYIKREDQVLRGASGDVVHPGDVLRFTYTSERSTYFALLNADPKSSAIYHPLTPATSFVEAGRDSALGFGIVLDDQLGAERVFGLFCETPVELEPIRRELQSRGRFPDLPGCSIDVLLLDKRAR